MEQSLELTRKAFYERAKKNAEYMEDDFFGSIFGVSFEAGKEEFFSLMRSLADIWTEGSAVVMDYADEEYSGEAKTRYDYFELEHGLSECGFRIYEHINNQEAKEQFFYEYNIRHIRKQIKPPLGVNYLLAVRKW